MIKVDHIAFAVHNMEEVVAFFKKYFPVKENMPRTAGFDGSFEFTDFYIGDTKIEIIEDINPDGFVKKFLEKRGPGFHHITFYVDDLDALVGKLESDGIRVVDKWTHGEWKTAFIHPKSAFGILIQFWETPESRKMNG